MIICINKPLGWTSFDVVKKARGILGIKKMGHAGTLDPLASGVLVLLTDKDTKKQTDIMKSDKEYIAEIAFGGVSETYDLELPLIFSNTIPTEEEIDEKLPAVLKKYTGKISQKAPAYSAKKVDGKRLYKMARKGTIDFKKIPVKEISIYKIELISHTKRSYKGFDNEEKILPTYKFRIICSSGTYIRSLAYDIGHDLGFGGVLASLVRTRVGTYRIEDSIKIGELKS